MRIRYKRDVDRDRDHIVVRFKPAVYNQPLLR